VSVTRKEIAALETRLGYRFRSRALVEQALTHSSHAHELEVEGNGGLKSGEGKHNEQLEFLGDAVLGFVTSQALFERFPEFREGELSKLRAYLVSARHLIRVARELQLGSFLRLGRGEEKSGGRNKAALLVDALEAVLAAVFLDGGMEPARQFVLGRILNPELKRLDEESRGAFPVTDYKSALQESLQAAGKSQPAYVVTKEEGPDHKKTFTVEVRIFATGSGRKPEYVAKAEGPSKKSAEQRAARRALEYLEQEQGSPNG
jgi:ribonuclease-3